MRRPLMLLLFLLATTATAPAAEIAAGGGWFEGLGRGDLSLTATVPVLTVDEFTFSGDLFLFSGRVGAGVSTGLLPAADRVADLFNGKLDPLFRTLLDRVSVGVGLTWDSNAPLAFDDMHGGLYWRLNVVAAQF